MGNFVLKLFFDFYLLQIFNVVLSNGFFVILFVNMKFYFLPILFVSLMTHFLFLIIFF